MRLLYVLIKGSHSHGELIKEVFPHIELFIGESGNCHFEPYNEVASVSLLVDDALLADYVLGILGSQYSFPTHHNFRTVQMLKTPHKTE